MSDCICGNPEGANKECGRCRLLADIKVLQNALDNAVETLRGIRAAPTAINYEKLNEAIRVCLFARNTTHG